MGWERMMFVVEMIVVFMRMIISDEDAIEK